MSKHCTRCGTDKPRELFNKNNRSGDGLTQWCKPCYADYRRENRDHRIAYNREYRATQQLLPSKRARRTPEEVVQRTLARERARDARRRQARDCHWLSGYRARCRKRGVDPVVKPFTLDEFFEVNPDACCRCGDIYWELDHKIPITPERGRAPIWFWSKLIAILWRKANSFGGRHPNRRIPDTTTGVRFPATLRMRSCL